MVSCEFGTRAWRIGAVALILSGCTGLQQLTGNGVAGREAGLRKPSYDICTGTGGPSPNFVVPTNAVARRTAGSSGLSPADVVSAYNLPSATEGTGQIVAFVDFCDNPNVASDLAEYRSNFGLPAANFYKFNEYGEQGNYPPPNKLAGTIIDVDVEMVSITCPSCTIYLIEANNLTGSDLETAEETAVTLGAHIVANSWGCGPKPGADCVEQKYFDRKGVTYIASGAPGGWGFETYPAAFDSVVAAGGTYLTQGGGGKRGWTETIWPNYGGGCFPDDRKPPWQRGTNCAGREANDVSIVAANLAFYDSYGGLHWSKISGTGLPQGLLAGVFALAGNATNQNGGRTFWQAKHRQFLYKVRCGSSCVRGRYSYPDGWGSPDGTGAF